MVGLKRARKRCVSRGRRKDFVLCEVDVWAWDAHLRKGCWFWIPESFFLVQGCSYRTSYASAGFFRGRCSLFEASTSSKSLKRIVILRLIVLMSFFAERLKMELLCETSFKHRASNLKNEDFLQGLLQK